MTFSADAQEINARLRQRLTRGEFFAFAMVFCAAGIFAWLSTLESYSFVKEDFYRYLNTAHGDFSFYYYGYWLLPIFAILAKLPTHISYILWCSLNILGVFFAARVFSGKVPLAILSYQMLYSLIYGQISGLIVGGLALCWWGLVNRKWNIAGIGIILASAKYQMGLTGILFLFLAADDIPWKDKLRTLILPILVWTGSLIVYPSWPLQALNTLSSNPPNDFGSISLWRWIGPWALLLWLPPFLLPHVTSRQRFIALVAVTGLALPYFQQTDLLFMLTLPIGWIGLLGNIGFLLETYGWIVLQIIALMPLIVYLSALTPAITNLMNCFLKRDMTKSLSSK
jgi:hypothetical protein